MKKWSAFSLVISIIVVGLAAAGCKQGLGDRCQVSTDCAEGVCSSSEPKVCTTGATDMENLDASVPIDSPDAATP